MLWTTLTSLLTSQNSVTRKTAIYLQPIITKLPGDIQNHWQKHAFRFKNEQKVDYPPFHEFSKFIQNLALERNDPNLTPETTEKALYFQTYIQNRDKGQ